MSDTPTPTHTIVREHYAGHARAGSSCCSSNTLYPGELLASMPGDVSNFSLGCGDPISAAKLQPGETVLDLGSGGGLDCFLAARQVGAQGHVIGVDMTPEMLARARTAAARLGAANVEFREGFLENLPVEASSVDVVLSNCVINLSPDKPAVFREVYRALRPGGRVSVSDIVVRGALPEAVLSEPEAWSECVAGALDAEEYARGLEAAGFADVRIQPKDQPDRPLSDLPMGMPFSALITAVKPADSRPYFAQVADQWDQIRAGYFTEAMRDAAIARAGLPAEAVVADVGTGTGFVAQALAQRAARVYGFDASLEMLDVARRNLAGFDNVELRQASGDQLPLPDGALDGVFANMFLHHAPDPAAAIREMARLLKPGGVLCLTDLDTHTQTWMREAMADVWLGFERDDIRRWLEEAGLERVEVDCAEGSCECNAPAGDHIKLSIFVALGRKP